MATYFFLLTTAFFALMFTLQCARYNSLEKSYLRQSRYCTDLDKRFIEISKQLNEAVKSASRTVVTTEPITAAGILKSKPARLKLRKSWADIEQELEDKHDTKRKKHERLTNEIKSTQENGNAIG